MKNLGKLKLNKLSGSRMTHPELSNILGGECTVYNCQCTGSWENYVVNGDVTGSQIVSVTLYNRSSAGTI